MSKRSTRRRRSTVAVLRTGGRRRIVAIVLLLSVVGAGAILGQRLGAAESCWPARKDRTMKRSLMLGVAVLIMAVGLMAVNRTESASLKTPASAVRTTKPPPAQGLIEHRQLVRVFVHIEDIYPDEAHVRPGKVLLVSENETQKDVSLVVEKVKPGQQARGIAVVRTPHIDRRARQELTLDEGEYVFYEATRPGLQGKLIVDSQ